MARTPDNPYLAARQEWNERYGSYVKAAAAWRIVGITGMALAVIGTSYALYQSTQVKLVPYIIEVDKLGNAVTAGFPQQIEYADPRVVRASLAGFVSSFRSVSPDTGVQKQYHRPDLCAAAHRRSGDREGQRLVSRQLALRQSTHRYGFRRGQQRRRAFQSKLPNRLERGRARPSRQGALDAALSRRRHGDAGAATGRGRPSVSIPSVFTCATSTGRRNCEQAAE